MADRASHIRNFSIIAHIDHGKSTLADRLLDKTGALSERQRKEQFLDNMDLERERGITIKAQSVRLNYKAKDGHTYEMNLIDTPGHVDFSYEVSRSLSACEGAILVVDAAQGVQAQTLANVYLALDANLEIIPVLNKIDLPSAEPDRVKQEIEEVIGLDASQAINISAKTGMGVEDVLEAIVTRVPPPTGDIDAPLQGLIFDSWYDSYKGVIVLIRVVNGTIRPGMKVKMMATRGEYEVQEVGINDPFPRSISALKAGEVGYLVTGIKELREMKVGDTVTELQRPATTPLPGFKHVKPMVFAGIFPTDPGQYGDLRDALEKLILNDSSFTYDPETSVALGFGFRCGFLGMLHMEIIQERLEREYDLDLISTAPTVRYKVYLKDGSTIELDNPADLPDPMKISHLEEPTIRATIHTPNEYVGALLAICEEKRGVQTGIHFAGAGRVMINYILPLAEAVYDFYDKIKSNSRGYASLDYELADYQTSDLVKLDIMVNGEPVDALSTIVHKDKAFNRGQELCRKLKELIPRQMYEVAIQAAIGTKVIARTTVKAFRKNVTAKCYGGDISRKRKLLEKQKAGKKRMKTMGNVEIPQEAFHAVLKVS